MVWLVRFAWQRVAFGFLLSLLPLAANAGFSIANGQLVDANGAPFVMRGMSYPYAWYTSRGDSAIQQDLTHIAATKANTVRFVLSSGEQWARVSGAQVSRLIQWAKARQLIAVLEVHDTTGWSESAGAVPMRSAVAYWTSPDIREAINGQESYVIINIANEPFGNTTSARFATDTIAAVQALRSVGLTHTLMVDAANWGQDWSNTMRDNATRVWNADVQRNLVFSVHMYEVYGQSSTIAAYMQAFDDLNLPLVIGEFGPEHNGQNVDEAAIMAQAQQRKNGYLAWSWSGNGSCCTALDMVSNFGSTLTAWGQMVVNGANGIASTSVPATVFSTAPVPLTVSSSSLSLAATTSSTAVAVTASGSWTAVDNQGWLTVSPVSGSRNGSLTVSAAANTGTAARSGTVTVSGGGVTRTIAVTQAAPAGAGSGSGSGSGCANVVTFSGNTGNMNATAGACFRTNATVNGWGCYNFDGRTVTVGGVARACGQMPIARSADGYYYFSVSGGTSPWAGIVTW